MKKMKLIPDDEMAFVLKPYAPPWEKEFAKILSNTELSSDIKMQLYNQAMQKARGLSAPVKVYTKPVLQTQPTPHLHIEKPPESPLAIPLPVTPARSENQDIQPENQEEIRHHDVSQDDQMRDMISSLHLIVENIPKALDMGLQMATKTITDALIDRQYPDRRQSTSTPYADATESSWTVSPEKTTTKSRRKLTLPSPPPKDESHFLSHIQELKTPSVFDNPVPPVFRNTQYIPASYQNAVASLFRSLAHKVPHLDYTNKAGQLFINKQAVDGAFLPDLLLDMVRSTSSFKHNPMYPGVSEILDVMKDVHFPAAEIKNPDFRKIYNKVLSGEELPGQEQTVFTSLKAVSPKEQRVLRKAQHRQYKKKPESPVKKRVRQEEQQWDEYN